MPRPMPMPFAAPRVAMSRPAVRLRTHWLAGWGRYDGSALGAFRAVLRDPSQCVRNVAARVLGRAQASGAYEAFTALLRDQSVGLRETGALGLAELRSEARREGEG